MKCYIQIIILSTIIAVQWIGEVKCKPHKHLRKPKHIEKAVLPIKHVSFLLEKITPFGKFEFKHVINKREAELSEAPPPEVPIVEGTIDAITEAKNVPVESHLDPEVIITSIVKPVENAKPLSLSSPFNSELIITPVQKTPVIVEAVVNEVECMAESELKLEEIRPSVEIAELITPVVEITPKPIELISAPEPPVEPEVVINAVEKPLPPIVQIPIYGGPFFPYMSSVSGNIEKKFLYTDINQIPLNIASYPAPVAVPVPEVILSPPSLPPPLLPPPPPPPIIKEDPPKIKEERPNFFVKGSRLVLYVGSMMLQMLSKFVNGGFNINQIPIPIIPGMQ